MENDYGLNESMLQEPTEPVSPEPAPTPEPQTFEYQANGKL